MKIEKIRNKREFSSIYKKGQKVYTRYAIIFVTKNLENKTKFGFVASKKTGNAVQRNRIKRLFREFVRKNIKRIKNGNNYIFIGKSILKENTEFLKYKEFEKDLMKVIR